MAVIKILSGGEAHTTNNRMELMAAIKALSSMRESCKLNYTQIQNIYKRALRNGSRDGKKWLETCG